MAGREAALRLLLSNSGPLDQGLRRARIVLLEAADDIEKNIARNLRGHRRDRFEILRDAACGEGFGARGPKVEGFSGISGLGPFLRAHDPQIDKISADVGDLRKFGIPGKDDRDAMLARQCHEIGCAKTLVTDLDRVTNMLAADFLR